ncbi:MAG: hypothetical protein IJP63_00920 [Acholeplasmatales bacterium]|nr:hypothetical protein [Acholeplasmatales bacterium]
MDRIELNLKGETSEKISKIILVEGESDLAFLSLYLCRRYGYEYYHDIDLHEIDKNMHSSVYSNGNDCFAIFTSGGVTKMNSAFGNIKERIFTKDTKYFVVIIDSDNKTKEKIISDLKFDGLELKANEFTEYQNDDFDIIDFKTYVDVVPKNRSGALETVILDSIRKDEKEIVDVSCDFVEKLTTEQKKHIKKARIQLKAKTGVVFNLLNPDHTFSELQKKFMLIDMNSPVLTESFAFFDKIFIS